MWMFLFQPGSTGNLVKEERDPFSRLHEARRSKFFMQIELRHLWRSNSGYILEFNLHCVHI